MNHAPPSSSAKSPTTPATAGAVASGPDRAGPDSAGPDSASSAASVPTSADSGSGSTAATFSSNRGTRAGTAPSSSSSSPSSGSPSSGSQWITSSSSIHLARSKQTWTGAGSAAGYVLRYLIPMRRLMVDVVGGEKEADRALAILVAHLVKAGFSGHDKGRLRDFLVRGIRSAAKAGYDECVQQTTQPDSLDLGPPPARPTPPNIDAATLESPAWLGYWRDGILQRSWRSLERYQHARRYERWSSTIPQGTEPPVENLVHDVLRVAMSHPSESVQQWAGRVNTAGCTVTEDEFRRQLELGRIRFAQQIADEVAQTLETPDPLMIQAEIKSLGLGKAFAGMKVQA